MLIEEIEEAEKEAEEILSEAREKATARIARAKAKPFEEHVVLAKEKAEELLKKAESEAKEEARKLEQGSKRKFSLPADSRKKLSRELSEKVAKSASA